MLPTRVDLIVLGRIVTMRPSEPIYEQGALAVSGGQIVAVGAADRVTSNFDAARTIAEPHALVLPGFVDAHTHVTQALVRGLIAHELPMIQRVYAPATQAMTPSEAGIAARLCAAQLLLSGVTTVGEGTIGASDDHLDAVVQGLKETGIRANIAVGRPDQTFHHAALYEQSRKGSSVTRRLGELDRDLKRTDEFLRRYPPSSAGLVTGAVCASNILAYSADYIREADALATTHGARLHVHASRDREEVECSMAVFGRRPIEQLADWGVISPRLVVAHAMLATAAEITLLARGGAAVAHSPLECLNILNAVPNVALMRALGIEVGLGCDNAANDMFSVMRGAWAIHTAMRGISDYDPEVLPADAILRMATIGGASVLGLGDTIGSLDVGKRADIVVLSGAGPHMRPTQCVVPEIVRYGGRGDVRHVVVDGRVVVDSGALVSFDLEKTLVDATAAALRIRPIAQSGRYRAGCCT